MSMATNQKIMRNIAVGIIRKRELMQFNFACKQCGEIIVSDSETARNWTGLCPDCLKKH